MPVRTRGVGASEQSGRAPTSEDKEVALVGRFFTLRLIGKGLLAVGFLLSLYGFGSSNPIVLKLSLIFLVVGIILQAWGLYSHLRNP